MIHLSIEMKLLYTSSTEYRVEVTVFPENFAGPRATLLPVSRQPTAPVAEPRDARFSSDAGVALPLKDADLGGSLPSLRGTVASRGLQETGSVPSLANTGTTSSLE